MLKNAIRVHLTRYVPYNINVCFQVVRDVEHYPLFLDYVNQIRILQTDTNSTDYEAHHRYQMLHDSEWMTYSLQSQQDLPDQTSIQICSTTSKYVDCIRYDWQFRKLSANETKLTLNMDVLLKSSLYYPMWLGCKDHVIDRNVHQYMFRIREIQRERDLSA
jgi:ribosome-associated toxin RatA of RatAB toxin-antitoxin module